MAIPTIQWDESNPSGQGQKAKGGERIREFKTQLREILGVDHYMTSSGNGDQWGFHDKVTLYEQSSDPLPSVNTGVLYTKEVNSKAELFWNSENDFLSAMQLTSEGDFIAGMKNEVRIFSGALADIPAGWSICDGTGTKPNLIDRFVRGVNSAVTNPGTSGGNSTITMTEANMPTHTHTVGNESLPGHQHQILVGRSATGSNPARAYFKGAYEPHTAVVVNWYAEESTHTHTTSSAGSGSSWTNLPAYMDMIYIIKE